MYDERFYHKIMELWAESYFAIAKRKTLVDDAIGMIRTPKEGFYYVIAKSLADAAYRLCFKRNYNHAKCTVSIPLQTPIHVYELCSEKFRTK